MREMIWEREIIVIEKMREREMKGVAVVFIVDFMKYAECWSEFIWFRSKTLLAVRDMLRFFQISLVTKPTLKPLQFSILFNYKLSRFGSFCFDSNKDGFKLFFKTIKGNLQAHLLYGCLNNAISIIWFFHPIWNEIL